MFHSNSTLKNVTFCSNNIVLDKFNSSINFCYISYKIQFLQFLHLSTFSLLSNILRFYHLLTTYQSYSRNFKTRVKFTFFVAKTFAEMSTCNYQYNIFISQPLSSVNSHMYHLYLAFRNFNEQEMSKNVKKLVLQCFDFMSLSLK